MKLVGNKQAYCVYVMNTQFLAKYILNITSFELKNLAVVLEEFFCWINFLNYKIWKSRDNNLCKIYKIGESFSGKSLLLFY